MQNETQIFPPKEVAMELKKVGFNEPCVAYYKEIDDEFSKNPWIPTIYVTNAMLVGDEVCTAPTYDQVIGWFAEVHKMYIDTASNMDLSQFKSSVYGAKYSCLYHTEWLPDRQQSLLTAFREAIKLIQK